MAVPTYLPVPTVFPPAVGTRFGPVTRRNLPLIYCVPTVPTKIGGRENFLSSIHSPVDPNVLAKIHLHLRPSSKSVGTVGTVGTVNQINSLQVGTGKIAVGTGGNNNKWLVCPHICYNWPKCLATSEDGSSYQSAILGSHLDQSGSPDAANMLLWMVKNRPSPTPGTRCFFAQWFPSPLSRKPA
jgi:hypothetical protein